MSHKIKRKAVPRTVPLELEPNTPVDVQPNSQLDAALLESQVVDQKGDFGAFVEEGEVRPDFEEQLAKLPLESSGEELLATPIDAPILEELDRVDSPAAPKSPKVKIAFGEVKHFAGGLISHPYEATKHYSVLRHSHGLVFYKGPTTSIAITAFSDQPLPSDRQLWLQKRGFSGRAGLKVGAALGSRSAWIDVTPSIDATADLVPNNDERAWQRDIAKFMKKTTKAKHICNHRPYETNIVRIPHAAEDGYFRIVLCAGRKVLCPSPVFRYASSSLDPSILRGASITTLPLELGIWVGSVIAYNTANAAACGAAEPALTTVKSMTQPYQLNGVTQRVATTAYDTSGAADKVDGAIESVNQQYDEKRELDGKFSTGDAVDVVQPVGSEDGPEPPYPIHLTGKAAKSSSQFTNFPGVHSLEVSDVPQDTLLRFNGTYMGWTSVSKLKSSEREITADDVFDKWHQAVITVYPQKMKEVKVVEQKEVFAHVLSELEETQLSETKMSLMFMAFLHPGTAGTDGNEAQDIQMAIDIETVSMSLSRAAWTPDTVLERIKTASSNRSISEKIADARHSGQKQLDKVPIHKLGVRPDSMKLRDHLIGIGGICIRR